jgi:catechol-2,3-dioxygenase
MLPLGHSLLGIVTVCVVASCKEPGQGAPITGLSHVQLVVSDVGASARWYSAVLGLSPFSEDLDIGYVALKHRGAKIVVVLTKGEGPRNQTHGSAAKVLDHLAFAVPDGDLLYSWAEHLRELGVAHAGVVQENGHPSLQLRDPDGNAIELVAP